MAKVWPEKMHACIVPPIISKLCSIRYGYSDIETKIGLDTFKARDNYRADFVKKPEALLDSKTLSAKQRTVNNPH